MGKVLTMQKTKIFLLKQLNFIRDLQASHNQTIESLEEEQDAREAIQNKLNQSLQQVRVLFSKNTDCFCIQRYSAFEDLRKTFSDSSTLALVIQ